jgi:hypothetical protein
VLLLCNQDVNADLMYDQQPWYKEASMYATDPRLSDWRSRILVVMSKWMPRGDKRMYLQCQRIKGQLEQALCRQQLEQALHWQHQA